MEEVGGARGVGFGDGGVLDLYPLRVGDPLGGEGLEVLDGVAGGELEEGADEVEALVVGEVGGGFLVEGAAVEVLGVSVVRGFVACRGWSRRGLGPMPTWEKNVLMTVGVTASETVFVDSRGMAAGVVHWEAQGVAVVKIGGAPLQWKGVNKSFSE